MKKFDDSATKMRDHSIVADKNAAVMGGGVTFLIFFTYVIALYIGSFFI